MSVVSLLTFHWYSVTVWWLNVCLCDSVGLMDHRLIVGFSCTPSLHGARVNSLYRDHSAGESPLFVHRQPSQHVCGDIYYKYIVYVCKNWQKNTYSDFTARMWYLNWFHYFKQGIDKLSQGRVFWSTVIYYFCGYGHCFSIGQPTIARIWMLCVMFLAFSHHNRD